MSGQLSMLAAPAAAGVERAVAPAPVRNGRRARASTQRALAAPAVADGTRTLEAAQAAYDQALDHALAARTRDEVDVRFQITDQRAAELRHLARELRESR